MTEVERRFREAMLAIYREAKDIGYTPSIFLRMLNEKGALQTARQFIMPLQPSECYTRPWEATSRFMCQGEWGSCSLRFVLVVEDGEEDAIH